jgi:hypothetical protein
VNLTRKLLASLLVLSALGGLSGAASLSAFLSESDNQGQTFAAGTVNVSDDDVNAAMFNLSGQKPGTTTERCIRVTSSGSLGAEVRLHSDSNVGALGPYLNLTITPGTSSGGTFPSCASFTPDSSGALYDGTLAGFRSAHSSWATGLIDEGPGAATNWTANDSVVYRFAVSVRDDDAALNLSTGTHRFLVEARNE